MYGIYEDGEVIAKFVVPMTIKSNHPVFVSDTLSLSRKVSRRVAQRWEIETKLQPLSYSAQDLMVHLVTKGYSESFSVLVPQNFGVIVARKTVAPGTVSTTAAVSATSVVLSSALLIKGTYIKFANHSKVYMITSVSGSTIGVYPTLRTSVPANTAYTCGDDVFMTCKYDTDTVSGMVYSDGILMDPGTVKMVEAL